LVIFRVLSRPSLSLAISIAIWLAAAPMRGQAPAGNGSSPPPIAPVNRTMGFEWRLADRPLRITYSRRGLELTSAGGNYQARIQGRIQLRFSDPFPAAPEREADYQQRGHTFGFRRARLKMEGHAFRPWFRVNIEQDLADWQTLGWFVTAARWEWLQFRAGQFKPEFNRERVTSSARQQFAERSIVNDAFQLDRQIGFAVMGHVMAGRRGDSWYSAGVFTGNGRHRGFGGGGHPLVVGRYQWNFLGRDPGFSSSDVEHHDAPAAAIGLAAATNRRRYTAFSSHGGDQLEGFAPGAPGQYTLRQVTADFLLKYRGLSIQHETHYKSIYDHIKGARTHLRGAYAQAGYSPTPPRPGFPGLWRPATGGRFSIRIRRSPGTCDTNKASFSTGFSRATKTN
jgi:phosphate-selective porin OprO/OprP